MFTDDETATTPDAAPNLGGTGDYDGVTPAANLTGTLSHSYGADGAGSTLLLGSGAPAGFTYTLSGGGTILTISQVQGGSPVNVLRVTLTNATSGAYTVEQLAAIDHPTPGTSEENIQFAVGYQVTDHDGDTATGSLSIDVDDDTPTVASNLTVFTDDETATTPDAAPNLGGTDDYDGVTPAANLTGTLSHSYGADGAGSTLLLGSGAPAGFTYTLSGGGTILTISQIQDGSPVNVLRVTLTNTTSGAYTVEQLAAIDHPTPGTSEENIQFAVGYQVTDHDGDTATGSLSIDVDDDTPTVASNLTVFTDDETATTPDAAPNLGGTGDYDGVTPAANLTGTLSHSYGADGAGSTLLLGSGVAGRVHLHAERRRDDPDDQPDPGRLSGRRAAGDADQYDVRGLYGRTACCDRPSDAGDERREHPVRGRLPGDRP